MSTVCPGTENYLMDLEDGDESSLQIIRLGLLGVVDLNGMLPSFQVQYRRLVEILRKQIHIHGGGHHDDLRRTDGTQYTYAEQEYQLILEPSASIYLQGKLV